MKRHLSLSSSFLKRLGTVLCRLMHHQITRPVQGQYTCLECMRRYTVDF